jgi:hypothetical protein
MTRMVTIRGTFDAPDPAETWKLTFYGDNFGLWPEGPLPYFEFTGTTFTATFRWSNRHGQQRAAERLVHKRVLGNDPGFRRQRSVALTGSVGRSDFIPMDVDGIEALMKPGVMLQRYPRDK